MKTKLLEIKQILVDKETYPRMAPDFTAIARYSSAMQTGAEFPPITVGQLEGKYYLIDGMHRMTARKGLKETHITAKVILVENKQQVYIEAIKRNIGHGKQFTTQEVTTAIIKLERMNLSKEVISAIVRIPLTQLTPFVAKRAVHVVGTDGTTSQLALRSTLKHLAGQTVDENFIFDQNKINTRSQLNMVESLIRIIENGWTDLENKELLQKLSTLNGLLSKLQEGK